MLPAQDQVAEEQEAGWSNDEPLDMSAEADPNTDPEQQDPVVEEVPVDQAQDKDEILISDAEELD